MASVFKRGGKGNRGGYWYVAWFDHLGRRQTHCAKTTDRATAERIAAKKEAGAALRREGVIDTTLEHYARESRRPIEEHVADYERFLADKGNSPKHVTQTLRHIRWVIGKCEAKRVADLTGPTVQRAIGELRSGKNARSLGTCNSYLTSIKTLTRWLWHHKRTADDSLLGLAGFNEQADRRRVRRELSPEEIHWLLTTAENYTRPEHVMPGPDRAMVYRVALGTGFRASELRRLTPESFNLDADPPTITVFGKRQRTDVQPIRSDLAELLRPWLRGVAEGQRVFHHLPRNTARMLRSDLRAARSAWIDDGATDADKEAREDSDFLNYVDSAGGVADFHSTRHTYISGIVATGASVKTAQELARHSTPSLTIGRYSHTRLHDIKGALDALPTWSEQSEPVALQATGTDAAAASNPRLSAQRVAQQSERETVPIRANPCTSIDAAATENKSPADSQVEPPGEVVQMSATADEQRRRWESNPRWRICNPLP